jgi:hypothetical protein
MRLICMSCINVVKRIIFSSLVFFNCESFAQGNQPVSSLNKITFDRYFSPIMGADNAVTIRNYSTKFEEYLLKDSLFNGLIYKKNISGFLTRLGKVYVIDLNVASTLGLLQHEFYGHCWAYKQFGYENNSFKIALLPPFGIGSGSASYGKLIQIVDSTGIMIAGNAKPTLSEEILISSSGAISQQLLADKISQEFFASDSMDYRNSLLYLYNSRCISGMLLFNTGDMMDYAKDLNSLYGSSNGINQSLNYMKLRSLASFLNANDILSFYNVFYNYLIKGKTKMKTVGFGIKGVKYLPALRYTLTPFGGQYGLTNFFKTQKFYGNLAFNISDDLYRDFWNINFDIFYRRNNFIFGSTIDFWRQPFLQLESKEYSEGNQNGFCIKQELKWHSKKSKIGLGGQVIYKTRGYTPGEYLHQGLYARFSLLFSV